MPFTFPSNYCEETPNDVVLLCKFSFKEDRCCELNVVMGTEKADELGLEAVVESTEIARTTYEKCGF